jgi:prepilin-type N-terminal cleavage/methylation domain-containing protein
MSHVEPTPTPRAPRAGFSLVELVIAIIVLAFGVLGLAGTTALVVRQITLSDVNTEREAALQTVVERLRATSTSSITTGSATVGSYSIAWAVTDSSSAKSRTIRVITTGPGMDRNAPMPQLNGSVADTFTFVKLKL